MNNKVILKYEKTLIKSNDYQSWYLKVSGDWRRYVTFRKHFHNFYLEEKLEKLCGRNDGYFKKNKNGKFALIRIENKNGTFHSRIQIPISFIRKIYE